MARRGPGGHDRLFCRSRQVRAAADLIHAFKAADPSFLYLCDPVIGDSGGLYVAEAVASAIRDELLPLADLATPNRFELGWLAGAAVDDNAGIAAAARRTGISRVVSTSAHAMMKGAIANLLIEGDRQVLAEHQSLERAPNGLGDLFSALLLSHVVEGRSAEEALRLSSSSVFEIAARSIRAGADELLLQMEAASLSAPMASVAIRHLVGPGLLRKRVSAIAPLDNEPAP